MSDFSLTLVLRLKTSKIVNDMAKVQKIIEKTKHFPDYFLTKKRCPDTKKRKSRLPCDCSKILRCSHHWKFRGREILAISSDDYIGVSLHCCIVLHRILKIIKLRGQRVINYSLVSSSDT